MINAQAELTEQWIHEGRQYGNSQVITIHPFSTSGSVKEVNKFPQWEWPTVRTISCFTYLGLSYTDIRNTVHHLAAGYSEADYVNLLDKWKLISLLRDTALEKFPITLQQNEQCTYESMWIVIIIELLAKFICCLLEKNNPRAARGHPGCVKHDV